MSETKIEIDNKRRVTITITSPDPDGIVKSTPPGVNWKERFRKFNQSILSIFL